MADPRTIAASRVLWPDGALSPGVITVEDGRIAALARPDGPVPDRVVCPGFVDLQVNGIDDVDVAHADGDDWDRLDAALLAQGVTTWCPTLITAPWADTLDALSRIADAAARGPSARPRIAGAHLEGPWLGDAIGAHPAEHVLAPSAAAVADLPGGVALVTLGPEHPEAEAACRALRARGIAVAIGHSRATYEQSVPLVDAGASLVTHVGNATGPISARAPGVFGLGLSDERLAVSVIADLVHLHPAVLRIVAGAAASRLVLVTDAVAWRAPSHRARGITSVDGAPRLPDGTLAGSALTMDQAIRNLVGSGATDLGTALRAASTHPARVIGVEDRGVITVGALADLVALDLSLAVEQVWLEGQPV